jgi:hypothetical protein
VVPSRFKTFPASHAYPFCPSSIWYQRDEVEGQPSVTFGMHHLHSSLPPLADGRIFLIDVPKPLSSANQEPQGSSPIE